MVVVEDAPDDVPLFVGSIESFRFAEGLLRGVVELPEAVVGISDGGAMLLVSARGEGGRSEEYRRIG